MKMKTILRATLGVVSLAQSLKSSFLSPRLSEEDYSNITWTNITISEEPITLSLDTSELTFITKRATEKCRKKIVRMFLWSIAIA